MHDMQCVVGLKNKPDTNYGRSTNLVVSERYAVVVLAAVLIITFPSDFIL